MSFSSLRLPQLAQVGGLVSGLREYFAYHGVWAPGVRLLRRMTVRSKVLVVMGLTAAPLLPLTWESIALQNKLVSNTTQRLVELRLAGANFNFGMSLIEGNDGSAEATARLTSAWGQLEKAYGEALVAVPVLQQAWERNRNDIQASVRAKDVSAQARGEATVAALNAVAELRVALTEQALQAVEDDPVLNNSTLLAMDHLPRLQNALVRLNWQINQAAVRDGAGAASAREVHATQLQMAARLEALLFSVEQAEQRLVAVDRSAAAKGSLLAAARDYQQLVRTQTLAIEPSFDQAALRPSYGAARLQALQLWKTNYEASEQGLQRKLQAAKQLRLWVVGTLLSAITLAGYLLYCFFLVMRGGLVQLNHQMQRMAEGDLSARPLPVGGDEVAGTMRAMNVSLVRLSDLLASVRQGVGGVNQASQQVATGNTNLTNRNRETASSVAAVVDGVARYSAQLEACGRQVETVVNTVQSLRLESARNRKQMQRLRERMTALRSKSREIGEIVTLIDAIAFRTNILALNASVEASKAGETGRGFAVVAQEVRTLALRGAESARRIGDIVSRSTEDIELSGALAEDTGQALAAAEGHVDSIRVAMDSVSALTHGGEKESGEILRQLTSIRDGTTQSLGLVEQLAGASHALHTQGERLAHKIGQFKLS
jgi:methyl-accepting chemotaxis protein